MLKRLAVLAASASLLVGAAVPGWAASEGADAEVAGPSAPADPTVVDEAEVGVPQITSGTATTDAISIAWTWDEGPIAPPEVTSVIVRAVPGDHQVSALRDDSTALLDGLDADTAYAVTVTAVADGGEGTSSAPFEITTLTPVDTGSDVVDDAATKPMASPGEVERLIVTMKSDVDTEAQVESVSSDLPLAGVDVDNTQGLGTGSAVIDLDVGVSDSDAELIIRDLESDPRVASVEKDGRLYRTVFPTDPPDDPYWTDGSLWGLYGTFGIGIASSKTSMNTVWTSTAASQGDGAVVAVLDTGYTVHPDLNANYVTGYDFVSSDTSSTCRPAATNADGDYVDSATYGPAGWDSIPLDPGDWTTSARCYGPSDSSWHGTHVAGTIAAVGNNNAGIIGVAPQAKIQPVRVLGVDGGTYADITAAINWAAGATVPSTPTNATPADVINMSLGGAGSCPSSLQAAITNAVNSGVVVVVSAGNSSADAANYSPANCDGVITVASSTSSGVRSSFSNYGSTVEITAPGSGIWSTVDSGTTVAVGASYDSYSGTSMAAPHVAGVAALLKAGDPSRTPAQILSTIQSNALGFPTTGGWYDCTTSDCGAGLLRASAVTTPVVYSVSDETGPIAGGESTVLTGVNLGTVTGVTFGGTAASITAQTSTTLTVTTPSHASGAVDIVVTNPDGTGTTSDGYRYFDPPTASGLSVSSGSTAGNTTVIISGTDLAPADVQDTSWISVSFGGSAATVWLPGTTSVQVTTPAHAAGTVDVVVTTPGGSSTLAGAFTFVAPLGGGGGGGSSGGGGGGGSSASSSSSSSGSSEGGGGGGLNEITTIAPAASGAPGSVIALAGWGLSTTRAVTFNDYPAASWRVVSDSHVEVVVPDIPPGVYVIHDVLAPEVGRASYWTGFHVLPKVSTGTATPPALGTSPGATPPGPATSSAGDLVGFRPNSAALSTSTKTKLTRLATKVGSDEATGTILVFSDKRGTAKSKAVAKERARNIVAFLASEGVTGDIRTLVEKGTTSSLRKSAVVLLSTDPGASTVTEGERVDSLIVRYGKGVSPTVDGQVRGANYVTDGLGSGMTLGPNLGLRMYRVDFARPVSLVDAERAATQMMKDQGVQFAEPDRIVRANVTAG